jgi:hypothetical protein
VGLATVSSAPKGTGPSFVAQYGTSLQDDGSHLAPK